MKRAFSHGFITAAVLQVGAADLLAQSRTPHDHLDSKRAHFQVLLADLASAPQPPDISFYPTASLTGIPAMRLNRDGLFVGAQQICAWPDGAFDVRRRSDEVLVSAANRSIACPADLPIKSFESSSVYIEISEINAAVATTHFRGQPYFFGARLRADETWIVAGAGSAYLTLPATSPPLLGGVDIPAAFRPRPQGQLRLRLYEQPSAQSTVLTTISKPGLLETFSLGEGALVAAVYQRSQRWSLLRLIDGRTAWLAPDEAGKYVSLERLIETQETLRAVGWDEVLWDRAGGSNRIRLAPDPRLSVAGYLEMRDPDQPIDAFSSPNGDRQTIDPLDGRSPGDRLAALVDGRPIVFARIPGWLQVGIETDPWHPAWAKRMWIVDDPRRWEFHLAASDLNLPEPLGIEVLETSRIKGVLWLRVRVSANDNCYEALFSLDHIPLGEGWIPAHAANGRPNFWFEIYCD